MSLVYEIAFPQTAPSLDTFVAQVVARAAGSVALERETEKRFVVRQQGEVLLTVSLGAKSGYYELSFGDYKYESYWYIEFRKADGLAAMHWYAQLVGKLVAADSRNFITLFNGECVVLKRESGQLYLNTEYGSWDESLLSILVAGQSYAEVMYPVV